MVTKNYRIVTRRVRLVRPQPTVELLTSCEMERRFGHSINLHKIGIGRYLEHGNWRILHKGRDRWEVIRVS
jgi:hypothetical protein